MTSSRGALFLIDGSNSLFRSYYAIRGLTSSSGLATNAVYGFTQILRKLLKDYKPQAMAVAFDLGAPTFRHKQFEGYKKDRKPMPDDLSVQIPFIYELCEGFGIPVIAEEEYEADDLIGSLACKAGEQGFEVVLVTSDKDFFQLVGDGVKLYHTGREVLYDAKGIEEVFGLPPEKVVDVMAIWGDSIDNIPGVHGIGEKGAKALIAEYGSLEGVYSNLDKVKKGQREKLEAHRTEAFMSRELATIRCDLEIPLTPAQLVLGEPDRSKLHDLFSRLEFLSLMQEYMPEVAQVHRDLRNITDGEDLRVWLEPASTVSMHFEPDDPEIPDRPALLGLCRGLNDAASIQLAPPSASRASIDVALHELFGSGRTFVVHDMKQAMASLRTLGLSVPALYEDTMLVSYVLQPGLQSHTLESVARDRLKRNLPLRKEVAKGPISLALTDPVREWVAEKALATNELYAAVAPEIARDPALGKIYRDVEMPLVPVLSRMEQRGIRIDVDLLLKMSKTMGEQIDGLEKKIYAAAGQEFNINSPSQLGFILFEKMQYPVLRKTQKTKSSSTGVEVLKELAGYGHEVPQLILEHRELHKLRSTYVDALPRLVREDGRVHTSFNQAVAATGRLSSSDPNLQNIPIRTQQGREIRRAFIADEGNVLIAADYSQIELRILAHMTGDADLIDAFARGADIHRATAARVFGIDESVVTPEQRRASKTINFGVLYGMSAFRLSQDLSISVGEGKEFIASYFARYPTIQQYLDSTLVEARATGKVTTLFGRVRYIPEIHNRSFTVRGNAERMATNAPIQGTAADLLKLAMIALDRELAASFSNASMLLTVHDEIVIECRRTEVEAVEALVKTTMENIHPLAVPLAVDTGWGATWYDTKE